MTRRAARPAPSFRRRGVAPVQPPPPPATRAALLALRAALGGLAWSLLLLLRASVALFGAALRLVAPSVGAQGAVRRLGRVG